MDTAFFKIKQHKQVQLEPNSFLADTSKNFLESVQEIFCNTIINKASNMACSDLTMDKTKRCNGWQRISLDFAKTNTNNIDATFKKLTNNVLQWYFIAKRQDDIWNNNTVIKNLYKNSIYHHQHCNKSKNVPTISRKISWTL